MMSRWCDQSIPDERHSAFSSGPLEVAVLFGTLVAETILASVHVRAQKQAGHMDASDLIKHCKTPCKEGVVHIWKINHHWRSALRSPLSAGHPHSGLPLRRLLKQCPIMCSTLRWNLEDEIMSGSFISAAEAQS